MNVSTSQTLRPFVVLGSVVLVVVALSWAQKVLIPVAMAFLLALVLRPLVNCLERAYFGRVTAVVIALLLTAVIVGVTGSVTTIQVRKLVADLPQYKANVVNKISGLRDVAKGDVQQAIQEIADAISLEQPKAPAAVEQTPVPVRVEDSHFARFRAMLGPAAELLANLALVIVLVAFMLIQREDLRNRIVRLVGDRSLVSTTHAIDEAVRRISRFLVSQLLVNVAFGVVLSSALFVIGVPYAFLWGFITAMLRFVPYLGTWAAGMLLVAFTVIIFQTWPPTLYALAVFVVLEILTAHVIEPLLFGHSTGISTVALIVAAAFWTWLWGPIGLILSTPMTACAVVLGKYVSNLRFFDVLLGDEPALDRVTRYYQRLLARDQDEAADLVEEFMRAQPREAVYDELLLPALVLVKRDQERGELGEADRRYILEVTRELLDEVVAAAESETERAHICIIGCPARAEEDELALRMFQQLAETSGVRVDVLSADLLTGEIVDRVGQEDIALVCIASLPPGGFAKTRYLCKRLRLEFPRLPILVVRFGAAHETLRPTIERLQQAGATHVGTTLLETRAQALPLLQSLSHSREPVARARGA